MSSSVSAIKINGNLILVVSERFTFGIFSSFLHCLRTLMSGAFTSKSGTDCREWFSFPFQIFADLCWLCLSFGRFLCNRTAWTGIVWILSCIELFWCRSQQFVFWCRQLQLLTGQPLAVWRLMLFSLCCSSSRSSCRWMFTSSGRKT